MKKTFTSKFIITLLLVVFVGSSLFTGCAKKTTTEQTSTGNAYLDNLIKAAQKEGELTVIALPHDWANYGEIISTFSQKYGIKVNELDPNAGSGDEIEAIKANKGSTGPQAPDVIDVGLAWGPTAKEQGLIQPYKVQTWDTIPNDVKDPDGYWYGDYYGVLAFEVNSSVIKNIPQDWSDLLKPEYKGKVALGGDPRTSAMAAMAVAAAAIANGGSFDNVMPGLQYFAQLNKLGNFVPVIAKPGTIASGETPIAMMWDYLALTDRDNFNGNPEISVVIPKSSVVAGVYVQAISAYAPHPNAAKLWMEFLYSDEGQLLYLKGYVHPIRYNDLAKRNVIPEDLAKKLPPAELYAKAIFPTIDQISKAKKDIVDNWDKVVNVNVK
ncbi:MAG: ABC transporter substrate-binding protein [Caldisericum exile]|uniref:ABC transporter substrate-binding protein n=1 Tax=Caldisericum exile TaxID=693075 RepID=UPI003C73A8CF